MFCHHYKPCSVYYIVLLKPCSMTLLVGRKTPSLPPESEHILSHKSITEYLRPQIPSLAFFLDNFLYYLKLAAAVKFQRHVTIRLTLMGIAVRSRDIIWSSLWHISSMLVLYYVLNLQHALVDSLYLPLPDQFVHMGRNYMDSYRCD